MSLVNTERFTSPFPTFISFSYLISLAKTSSTILNRNCRSGHLCLVPDLRGPLGESIQCFTIKYIRWQFLRMPFIRMIGVLISYLLSVFIQKGSLFLLSALLASIEMTMWSLTFVLWLWCVTAINFQMLYQPCTPRLNANKYFLNWIHDEQIM